MLTVTLVLVGSTVSTPPAGAADPLAKVRVAVPPMATDAASIVQSDFGTEASLPGNFDLVVPQGHDLVHYWRGNGQANLPWHRAETITAQADGPGSLIQSSIGRAGAGTHGDLEVVVRKGSRVVHYFRESGNNYISGWQEGQTFGGNVVGPPAIIQSDFKPTNLHGTFEVVVPEQVTTPTGPVVALVHYTHPNPDRNASRAVGGLAWQRENDASGNAKIVLAGVTATARPGLIQSDFSINSHGRIEVLANRGVEMVHVSRDLTGASGTWDRTSSFAGVFTGGPAFIQSTFKVGANANFEAAVLVGGELWHWWRDNSVANSGWQRGQRIGISVRSPGSLVQSTLGRTATVPGRFEVVAPAGNPPMTLPDSQLRAGDANLGYHLLHGYRDNNSISNPWNISPDPITHWERSAKICQLTGEKDEETGVTPYDPQLLTAPAVNQTASRFNLGYTDLGFPVEDDPTNTTNSRIRFYFGDSNNRFHDPYTGISTPDDAVGVTNVNPPAPTATKCPAIWIPNNGMSDPARFPLGPAQSTWKPLQVLHANQSTTFYQGLGNVPTSGFTLPAGSSRQAYTFFFTDWCFHFDPFPCGLPVPPNADVEGRAVLTRNVPPVGTALDSATYDADVQGSPPADLGSLPKPFNIAINAVDASNNPSLTAQEQGVYVYTLNRYRMSYPRLIFHPKNTGPQTWKYLADDGSWVPFTPTTPRSTTPIANAKQLFTTGDDTGCMGEMSVSWVGAIGRWVMLYNCQRDSHDPQHPDPGRIQARMAEKPWGPWSDPVDILDPRADPLASNPAYTGPRGDGAWCRFIYAPGAGVEHPPCADSLNDNLWQQGGPYGPYIIDRYTTPTTTANEAEIVFTLSTWNPYNVVLMKARLVRPT
jgi:hypothetical protein